MLNIKIGTKSFFKLSALFMLVISMLFAFGFILCNTYFGWKIQQSAYRLSDDFSGCRESNHASPTAYVENSILKYNSSSRGLELPPFRQAQGDQFYDEHGIKYIKNIYNYSSYIINEFNLADIKCWAGHGDPMAIMWLYTTDYLGYNYGLKDMINEDPRKISYEELIRLLDKISTNNFNLYNNSENFSVCNDALAKGIITCRRNFPEAYFVKALYTCKYFKDEKKALELIKTAYFYGDMQAKVFIDGWDAEDMAKWCRAGEGLVWVN